jgi:hypothetical protein
MRRTRMLGTSLATVLAIAATTAGAAWGRQVLVVSDSGTALAKGSSVTNIVSTQAGRCVVKTSGVVLVNEAPTDKFGFGPPAGAEVGAECQTPGYSVSGAAKEVQLTRAGKATFKMKPSLALIEPGPCIYEFARLNASFAPGFAELAEGEATGKLQKKASKPNCAATTKTFFLAGELGASNGEPLESELRG